VTEPRTLIRIDEAAKRLAISRTKAYELAQEGRLPGVVKIGDKGIRVSVAALDAWIDEQAAETAHSA
jgi:excisionase family DNA binding protein